MSLVWNGSKTITRSQAKNLQMYLDMGWQASTWQATSSYPTLVKGTSGLLPTVGSFNGSVTLDRAQYKYVITYETIGWDMEGYWTIDKEGELYPRLIRRAFVDFGIPLTHNMNYVYVIPHINGTMKYMGSTWKSKGPFFSFPSPPAQGVLGQEVTYSIPDSDLNARIVHDEDGEIDVVWFASGIRDLDGAGGFGSYNDQKRRTITVGGKASATVNFYFTQPHLIPTVNYKVSISTPDGVVDVRAVSKEMSALKFCVDTNIQLGIALVEPNSSKATKIRVAMPEGIKAFEVYTKYKDVKMEED